MGKIKDFFRKIGSDLDRVHVRAAFVDVEHRVAHLFQHQGEHLEKKDETDAAAD